MLLERRLRVGVDPVGQLDDLVPGGLDGRGEARLRPRRRAEPGEWRSARARESPGWTGGDGATQPSKAAASGAARQRSADRVASATTTRAIMNRAIGSSRSPWSRSTIEDRRRRCRPRPPRRTARSPVAAVGDPAVPAEDRQPERAGSSVSADGQPDERRADDTRRSGRRPGRGSSRRARRGARRPPAAAKMARFAVRSRGSMTSESRPSAPSTAHGRISRASAAIGDRDLPVDAVPADAPGRERCDRVSAGVDWGECPSRRSGLAETLSAAQRATLDGQMSRNAQ